MRINVQFWQEMQEEGYFESHPYYGGGSLDLSSGEIDTIESFTTLTPTTKAVIIGCGYGRDAAQIAPRVGWVYGIDVSDTILQKTTRFLAERAISNFTPVKVDRYKDEIPNGIDLVFSIAVMQHITRDLVWDYFSTLATKLRPGGSMVIQFLQYCGDGSTRDADLRKYEPSVSWSPEELAEMCQSVGLAFEYRTLPVADQTYWYWVHARRPILG